MIVPFIHRMPMPSTTKLLLHTATAIEAQPLIGYYRLQRDHHYHPFPLYHNKERSIWLIESGIGSLNAASAISAAFHYSQAQPSCVCLNIGIAGGEQPLGSVWQIHKITDTIVKKNEYPGLVSKSKIASINLQTHPSPCSQYAADSLVDMEGSGFYSSASRYLVNEQIGLLKLVSDNSEYDHHQLNKQKIQALLQSQLQTITQYCDQWLAHAESESIYHQTPPSYRDYLQQQHFTQTQQHQLKRLLQQWQTLYPERNPQQCTQQCSSSKTILTTLNDELDQVKTRW